MIRNYQQRQRLNPPAIPVPKTAVVAAVNGQTARLTFGDGETSQKYYKSAIDISDVSAGRRVKIEKQSGTFIIMGLI